MKNKKVSAIVSSMIIGMTGTVSSLPNTVYAEETPDTVIEKNLDQEVKNKKQTEDAQVEEKSIQRGENKYKLDHIYRNNNANGKEVSKQVKEPLQSIKYEKNDVVANLLAPNRFSGVDKLNKKQEIAKRDNISIANVTDEQVEKELKEDNVHVMSYGQSFLDT
ncbi:MAG: hypothetical protein E6538_13300 [Paeniclostridium sordellii]|nr:hypothetical protein [Paeniclostridium sordellii]